MLWFGADADIALWAVIVSVVWKVLGFGMLLFVAAIHAIPARGATTPPRSTAPATGARARHITLPLTARTILLVTLVSAIGSLLAFDQFYIMTAGQPRNMTATSVFLIYLNSFPYLKLGYGAALSLILAAHHPRLHRAADRAARAGRAMTKPPAPGALAEPGCRARRRRADDSTSSAAICIALCTVMLLPLVASVLASLKTTVEAAAVPPTYFPHALSFDSYERLWNFQAGLPHLPRQQLRHRAPDHRLLPRAHHSRPATRSRCFPIPGKEVLFLLLLLGLIIPYQALLTPIFFMFVKLGLTNSLVGLAIVHTAIQLPFSVYVMRNAFEAVPRELEEAAVIDGCQLLAGADPGDAAGDRARDHHRRALRLHHLVERVPRRAGHHEPRLELHAAARPRRLAPADQPRRHRLGHAAGRASPSRSSPAWPSTCCCRNTTSPGFTRGAVK